MVDKEWRARGGMVQPSFYISQTQHLLILSDVLTCKTQSVKLHHHLIPVLVTDLDCYDSLHDTVILVTA
jgi:hypothetical protein